MTVSSCLSNALPTSILVASFRGKYFVPLALALTIGGGAQVQTHDYQDKLPTHLNFDGSVIAGIDFSVPGGQDNGYLAVWERFQPSDLIGLRPLNQSLAYEGSVLSLTDAGDQALVHLPTYPAWGAVWTVAGGVQPLPTPPGQGFALMSSGDGSQTFGFSASQELLRWSGVNSPQVVCASGCTITPHGVTTDGAAMVGSSVFPGSEGLYYWSWVTGRMTVQQSVPPLSVRPVDISSDGMAIYGITGSEELFRWTPAVGQLVLGKPTWATALENVWVNNTGDRVFCQARISSSLSKPAMWEPNIGWTDLTQYWSSQGAPGLATPGLEVMLRGISRNGKAAIITYQPVGAVGSVRSVVYFDGPAPGTIGSNYCGYSEAAFFDYTPSIYATGSETVATNSVTLHGYNLPVGQFAIALNSRGQNVLAGIPGTIGTLCLGGGFAIGRHNRLNEIQMTGGDGSFALALDLNDLANLPGAVAVQAGETWNFQLWTRRLGNPGSTFSDAVSISFQ